MILSVKNECGVKAHAGPVLSYHQFLRGGLQRMTDEEWKAEIDSAQGPPRPAWTEDFIR